MNWTEVIPRHNISAGEDASTSREETRAFQWNIYNLGQQLVKQHHIRGQMRRWPAALQQSSETQHIYTQTKHCFWGFLHCFSSSSRRGLTNHFRVCIYMYLADTFIQSDIQKRTKTLNEFGLINSHFWLNIFEISITKTTIHIEMSMSFQGLEITMLNVLVFPKRGYFIPI